MPDPLVDRLRAELEQTGIRVAAAMVVLERSRRRGDEIRFAITELRGGPGPGRRGPA